MRPHFGLHGRRKSVEIHHVEFTAERGLQQIAFALVQHEAGRYFYRLFPRGSVQASENGIIRKLAYGGFVYRIEFNCLIACMTL